MIEKIPVDISVFFRINKEINPNKSLEELYNSIVEVSGELLDSEFASLLLYLENEDRFLFKSTTDSSLKSMIGRSISEYSGYIRDVYQTRKPVIINQGYIDNKPGSADNGIDPGNLFKKKNIICIPLLNRKDFVGILNISSNSDEKLYTDRELQLVEVLAMISASALTSRYLYENLKKRIEELNALYELSKDAAFAENEKDFCRKAINTLAVSLNVERVSLAMYNENADRLEIIASYGSDIQEGTVIPDDSIVAGVFRTGKPVNISNVDVDMPEFRKGRSGYKTKAFVSIPLTIDERKIGVLNLTDKKNRRLFNEFELQVLMVLVSHIASIYQNYADRRNEERRKHLNQELKIASDIQRRNLAKIPRVHNSMEISVLYEPAKEVGGDFFDFYKVDSDRSGILVADVSGKGIPAALFTGTVKNILRSENRMNYRPVSLFTEANRQIFHESECGMFVTAFYGLIDSHNRSLYYSTAGHNQQMLLRRDRMEIVSLKTEGKPLGIILDAEFTQKRVEFETGDWLFLYTDGILEALGGELLDIDSGFEKLSNLILKNISTVPENVLNIIKTHLRENTIRTDIYDDLTVLIISL